MAITPLEAFVTIAGLTAVSLVTRAFFLFSDRELVLPDWVKRGLRYAPLAALSAVVVPEVVMSNGHLINTWHDARLAAVAAATAYYFWRRDILGTIVTGMVVLVPLKLLLGW
jgi:branched-subunit amino acid transport protein